MKFLRLRMVFLFWLPVFLYAQTSLPVPDSVFLLVPDRVFDGELMHEGWQVLVKGNRIIEVGKITKLPPKTISVNMKGTTLMPGLIEGHSHLLLHPYNETSWDNQVLNESRAERTARAVNHARNTLMAGFTSIRDLGTEGAAYDDVGLKTAIEKNIIPGPRMIVATRAIVAVGSYGPKAGSADIDFPKGAAEVGSSEELSREIRTEIGKGADLIKIYADYRWGPDKTAAPAFTREELKLAVDLAGSSGRQVVVHATTAEAMRRSVLAGVSTIEHGDEGTRAVFDLMKANNVALCPTLAAGDATEQYKGWQKGSMPEPSRITSKRKSFTLALESGVTICMGGDVGVFAHGDNAREMEMMVEYGMQALEVLKSATSINADVFGRGKELGRLRPGMLADIIAVEGNPAVDIRSIRKMRMVMKNGIRYRL